VNGGNSAEEYFTTIQTHLKNEEVKGVKQGKRRNEKAKGWKGSSFLTPSRKRRGKNEVYLERKPEGSAKRKKRKRPHATRKGRKKVLKQKIEGREKAGGESSTIHIFVAWEPLRSLRE